MSWQGHTKRLTRKTDHVLAGMALGQGIVRKHDGYFMRDQNVTGLVSKAMGDGLVELVGSHFRMTPKGKERWRQLRLS